ncbi:MAG: TIGR03435 family protein [Bryobacterales bacterium]|nr:TIGR03435 family protein [Bryobacterales bacterium]MBV9399943.1 TIGR03435 family protein [Bryobacterales bacterium]
MCFGIVLVRVAMPPASAQPTTAASFEVATIKLNRNPPAGARAISLSAALSHGRLAFEAVTLKDLVQQAYDLQRDQISGCPAWCDSDSDRFDVIANAEDPNITKDRVMLMLQALLADRFGLTSHRDTKERSGFGLVVDREVLS